MDLNKSDRRSMLEKLISVFNTVDESVGVMPFSGEGITGRCEMCFVPDGDRRITSEYLSGYTEYANPCKLMLRYSNLTPADRMDAIAYLEKFFTEAAKAIEAECAVTVFKTGDVRLETDNGSAEGVYSIPFVAKYVEQSEAGGGEISYYISFDGNEKLPLGVGVTMFDDNTKAKLYTRRYIHEPSFRCDSVGESKSYDFEFSVDCPNCALIPLAGTTEEAVVYKVFPSGEAEMVRCVLTEKKLGGDVCLGILSAREELVHGKFDVNTGIFQIA